uniref:U3 small nucleolar RNA-associated protein 18 homolog n=1 Tax=Ixodes ricinus TaxID=34613 RepID=A0A131Y610_IXORI
MLRTAVETKLLPKGKGGYKPPMTRSIEIEERDENSDSGKDSAEEQLEQLVFGSASKPAKTSRTDKARPKRKKKRQESDSSASDSDEVTAVDDAPSKPSGKRKPAWVDEDDEEILVKDKVEVMRKATSDMWANEDAQYSEHLKKRYEKLMGVPKWAEQQDAQQSSDEEDDEMLRKVGNYVVKAAHLTPGVLGIHKCRPLNSEAKENTILKSVEFHPSSQVALVAGLSGTATIYQVDGKVNPKIQAVHFDRFPIHCAHFSRDGREMLAGSSQRDHMFCYDMMAGKTSQIRFPKGLNMTNTKQFYVSPDGEHFAVCGRFGEVHLLSCKSKECVDTLKMNNEVKSVAFSEDGSVIYTLGGNEICIWDVKSRKCQHRFNDHGCVGGLSLAASPNGQYLVSGSDTGVVNVYETSKLLGTRYPTPAKAIMNLTTEVTQLKFNCTSELLAMSSSFKASSVKLVHFPSLTVFSNFPGKHDLKYPNCVDLSPHSGYFVCGDNLGTAHLFRLKHFSNF